MRTHHLIQLVQRALGACALLCSLLQSPLVLAQGTLEQIKVSGPSLAGNLEGNSAERDVFVYLPDGYANSGKRYPVIYFLHGYGATAQIYANGVLQLPGSAATAIAAGAQEAIIVLPDASSNYGGSMYSNSPTIGDWESFIAQDLVSYIDANYRTLATRDSRGLSGHSMGGYGTLRIGMKHPEVFGALYAMSSCCLLNNAPSQENVAAQQQRMAEGDIKGARGFANAMQAQAAAWAPNPQNAPYYFDFPYKGSEAQPLVAAKWTANSPLVFVDQYVPALLQYKGIMLDVGDKDGLEATNTQLDAALTRLGVPHGYEVYDGDHGNRVGERFVSKLLPFFSGLLVTQ
jgi:S-formylglutathione hydrolase FrmB